jgi:NAD(P)-dependent dehydrogenase (short-subunit alcohol dehydrogenase family)
MAREWAPQKVRVNAIAPGYMDNAMRSGYLSSEETVATFTPMARRGRPEELIGPAVFLACDASSYVTGTVLFVDGGRTAM